MRRSGEIGGRSREAGGHLGFLGGASRRVDEQRGYDRAHAVRKRAVLCKLERVDFEREIVDRVARLDGAAHGGSDLVRKELSLVRRLVAELLLLLLLLRELPRARALDRWPVESHRSRRRHHPPQPADALDTEDRRAACGARINYGISKGAGGDSRGWGEGRW